MGHSPDADFNQPGQIYIGSSLGRGASVGCVTDNKKRYGADGLES